MILFRLLRVWFGVVLGLSLWIGGCGDPGQVRKCVTAGDCLAGEICDNLICVPIPSPESSGQESVVSTEYSETTGLEKTENVNPEVVNQETSHEETVLTEPVSEGVVDAGDSEQKPDLPPTGCGSGPACKPQQRCLAGGCISRLCGPCGGQTGSNCGTGVLCLQNSSTKESFCGASCQGQDSCPPGFLCQDLGGSLGKQCVPPTASCQTALGMGGTCRGLDAATCPHHFPYCSSLQNDKEGICTTTCTQASSCPAGYKRCDDRGDGTRVCLPGCQSSDECPLESKICADDGSGNKVCQKGCRDHRDCPITRPNCIDNQGKKECQPHPTALGAEYCGAGPANALGVGHPCPNGSSSCSSGANVCLGQGMTEIKPFCSKTCTTDADCGTGAFCRDFIDSTGTRKVCLPDHCLCLEAPVLAQGQKDLFLEALQKVGRTRCSLIYSSQEMNQIPPSIANDPFRLNFFPRLHREPLQFLAWGKRVVQSLDDVWQQSGSLAVADTIAKTAAWLDAPVQTTPVILTVATQDPLAAAVAQFITETGGTPDLAAIKLDASDIPQGLQISLAKIILAMAEAAKLRQMAFPPEVANNPAYYFDRAHSLFLIGSSQGFQLGSPTQPGKDYWVLARDFGYQKMYQGAWNLAHVIATSGLKSDPSYKGFSFNQNTPMGRIIVSDNADHTYEPTDPNYTGAIALLVDTGGNDTYRIQAGANVSEKNGISILIDLDGNDKYGYVEKKGVHDVDQRFISDEDGRYSPPQYCTQKSDCGLFGNGGCVNRACQRYCDGTNLCPSGQTCDTAKKYCTPLVQSYGPISLSTRNRQGGARLGIAMLFDLGQGKDEYRSLRMSQGFGVLGVGILYDDGGDDLYQCEAGCQGAAGFGMGLLLDRGGKDTYLTYSSAQGFAYARGGGILLDGDGDDQYLSDHGDPNQNFRNGKGDPLYLSAQLPGQGNSSFVQGAAFGRRADGSDNMFMSGGLAVLRDRKGNDTYVAGVFAQGTGYWFGTGILADGDGKDTYDGLWYVQAATAHYALSMLLEGGGDDAYNTQVKPRATHTGVGHDYSISWLVDDSGNDTYVGAGLSLGAGNDNGFGFLVDNAGDDSYSPANTNSLGRANSPTPDTNPRNAQQVRTFGLFLDAGGTDTYKRSDGTAVIGNDKSWTQGRSPDNSTTRKLEHGVGVDGSGTSTISTR